MQQRVVSVPGAAARWWYGSVAPLLLFVGCNCAPNVELPVEIPEDAAERYASVVCEEATLCGCLNEAFDQNAEACESDRRARFNELAARHEAGDLMFDEDCFERKMEWVEDGGCRTLSDYRDAFLFDTNACEVFSGRASRGDACEPALFEEGGATLALGGDWGGLIASFCRAGLTCYAGSCVATDRRVAEAAGEACHLRSLTRCRGEEGYYCSREGICEARRALGEPCDTPAGCDGSFTTAYCAGLTSTTPGVCAQMVPVGASCDPDGSSTPCSSDGDLPYCARDGTCQENWAVVCSMVADRPGAYKETDWIPVDG